MHFPPFHKRKGWQKFFVGSFFGAICAYLVFMYMYGIMHERIIEDNLQLKSEVTELKRQNEALLQDNRDLDEKTKEDVKISTIIIDIENEKQLRLDRLLIHQLEELIKEEISHTIGQSIESIAASDELLISTIENKKFKVDDFSYQMEIKKLTVSTRIHLVLEAKIAK